MGRPYRAGNSLGDGTQGVALGYYVSPRSSRIVRGQASGVRAKRPRNRGRRTEGGGRWIWWIDGVMD